MESKLIIVTFILLFFNSAHAICIPRNRSTPSPSPDTPPNLKPVSSPPSPKPPTPSSPASKPSSPKAPTPSSSASKPSSPKAPTPSSSASTPSSPKAPTPSSPAPKPSSPKAPTPSSPAPKPSSPSPQQSSSLASSLDSSPSNQDQSPVKQTINALTSAIPKPGGGGHNPVIKKICDSTDYPDVCLATLGPISGPAADATSLLGVAIKAGQDFAKIALDTAQKLATQPGSLLDQVSSIKDCKDSYDDVSYNFERAADALHKKDVGTLNTMLSAALTDVGDCQDACEGEDSPLNSISDKLKKMASNCLAIVSLINI